MTSSHTLLARSYVYQREGKAKHLNSKVTGLNIPVRSIDRLGSGYRGLRLDSSSWARHSRDPRGRVFGPSLVRPSPAASPVRTETGSAAFTTLSNRTGGRIIRKRFRRVFATDRGRPCRHENFELVSADPRRLGLETRCRPFSVLFGTNSELPLCSPTKTRSQCLFHCLRRHDVVIAEARSRERENKTYRVRRQSGRSLIFALLKPTVPADARG